MGSDDQTVELPQSVRESLLGSGSGSGSRMQYRCSFCGKGQDEVQRLIAGPGAVYICDECVELCREIVAEEAVSGETLSRPEAFCSFCGKSNHDTEFIVYGPELPVRASDWHFSG